MADSERNALDSAVGSERADSGISRVRHPVRIVTFVASVALLLAVAFVAGQLVRGPNDEALQNAARPVPVFAMAEERVVGTGFMLPATVVTAPETDLYVVDASVQASSTPPVNESLVGESVEETTGPQPTARRSDVEQSAPAERVVLSATVVKAGDSLSTGAFVAEVSGRPLFALPSAVPRYRNIVIGDTGSDVRGLQQELATLGHYDGGVDGVFGEGTFDALAKLYKAAGYTLPFVTDGVRGFSWREFVDLPASPAEVVSIASIGTILSAETPLLRIRTSVPTLSALATTIELDALNVGDEVGVAAGASTPIKGTVVSVGAFTTDEETGASGYPVIVTSPQGAVIDASVPVQIRPWEESAPVLAVPAIAIRQDAGGAYVLVRVGEDKAGHPELERVAVGVGAQSDGWVSITEGGKFVGGAEVLVAGG